MAPAAHALVAQARRDAGLSVRELARLADVSFTTISRIETGAMDPTVGTLHRILDAAGRELLLAAEPSRQPRPALADLADAFTDTPSGKRPDWTRLRAFLDYLARHPDDVARAITARPR
ncbi:MAG: helix-turn-helix transcriptional regulator, partial [Frankiaceae bacterium]|nr:helix-turn-helix transcriptional regulator [Frankiaceae bacterium]